MEMTYKVIPFTLDMWKFSLQELAEKYMDASFLETHKVVGLSRVYRVSFTIERDEDDYDEDEDMGCFSRGEQDYFIQDPSYQAVVDYIREVTQSDPETEVRKDSIEDRLALVFENR